MAVRLSSRMAALADLVTPGVRLADVGTDHGYIPIFLCRTGKIPRAIAMDINRGPLQRAEAHVAECGLQEKIELRLSDGLHALAPKEADTILIAGMGGALIKRILSEGAAVLAVNPELVLQPQSEIMTVRVFLREIGYTIVDEDCVLEDGKFYFLMKAHRVEEGATGSFCISCPAGKKAAKEESDSEMEQRFLEDAFGPVLLKKKHPALRLFLERERLVAEEICGKLARRLDVSGMSAKKTVFRVNDAMDAGRRKLEKRLWEMQKKQSLIEKALRIYELGNVPYRDNHDENEERP